MTSVGHSCLSAVFKRFASGRGVVVKVPVKFVNASSCVGVKKGGYAYYRFFVHLPECHFSLDYVMYGIRALPGC